MNVLYTIDVGYVTLTYMTGNLHAYLGNLGAL